VGVKGGESGPAWLQVLGDTKRAELKADAGKIAEEYKLAEDAFEPFFGSLDDIRKLLQMDLTASGLGSVRDLVETAGSQAESTKQRLDALSAALEQAATRLAPPEAAEDASE
jgi:hypothetical protein